MIRCRDTSIWCESWEISNIPNLSCIWSWRHFSWPSVPPAPLRLSGRSVDSSSSPTLKTDRISSLLSSAVCYGSESRIRDPVLFLPLDGKKSRSRIRDEHPGSYFCKPNISFFGLKILKFSDTDPAPGSGIHYCQPWIRDGKKSDQC
jgi:hypothetical protein